MEHNVTISATATGTRQRTSIAIVVGRIIGLLLVLGIIGLVLWALWTIATDTGIERSVLWATGLAGLGWMIKVGVERNQLHERTLSEQKRQQYDALIVEIVKILTATEGKVEYVLDKQQWQMWSLTLAMVGSDDVVRKWNAFRLNDWGNQADKSTLVGLWTFGDLLLAMRKDCGHHGTRLRSRELLSLFVNDLPTS